MKKIIERIVESDGASNENDLWLNGATLKKFQNGEWIPVGGSMVEDEEYTIAQALNDLNERIEGLQEQLIPQKHVLRILNSTEGRVPMQECLALLELDGETPTCEQLLALLPFDNTEIIDPENFSLKVTALKVTSDGFVIFCGHPYSTGIDSASAARIDVSSTLGMITTEIV